MGIFKRRCSTCGTEKLRTDSGSVCPDWQCSASAIGSPGPPPELVRDAQLRAAGYVPATAIRPAMPTLQNPSPPEAPSPPPPKSPAARRAQEAADDIRWAEGNLGRLRSLPDEDMRWARGHLELLNRGKSDLRALRADARRDTRRPRPGRR